MDTMMLVHYNVPVINLII